MITVLIKQTCIREYIFNYLSSKFIKQAAGIILGCVNIMYRLYNKVKVAMIMIFIKLRAIGLRFDKQPYRVQS